MGVIRAATLAALVIVSTPVTDQDPLAWTRPIAPFHIAGPIYYVGTAGLAAYLIRTPRGAILIDGTMAQNAPLIERSIATLGVRLRDVRYILASHAHFDHVGGIAALRTATGASVVADAKDRAAIEGGHPAGENLGGGVDFPPAPVDRAIRDGDTVQLGGVTLTAVETPGHTPGCTSWTMRIVERGRPLRVVFPCSLSVAGNRLVGNRAYPGIVADYRRSFVRLAAIRADVVLPSHPEAADVIGRSRRGVAGLVDPAILPRLVTTSRAAFATELARQRRPR